jgi:hypothetical protein
MSGVRDIPNAVQVYNQMMPNGNIIKTIPQQPQLLANIPFEIDLTNAQSRGVIDQIQSAWIDNSAGTGSLTLNTGVANQAVIVPPGWQGWYPLLVSNPPVITLIASANATPKIQLCNVPMPAASWPAVGNPASATFIDWSVAATIGAAITLLIPANPARRYLYIEPAPGVHLYIGINGLPVAVPPSIGWLELNGAIDPSARYESGAIVSNAAIYYYDGAGGNQLTAYEV